MHCHVDIIWHHHDTDTGDRASLVIACHQASFHVKRYGHFDSGKTSRGHNITSRIRTYVVIVWLGTSYVDVNALFDRVNQH